MEVSYDYKGTTEMRKTGATARAICAVGSVIYELEKIRRDLVNNIEDYPESQ